MDFFDQFGTDMHNYETKFLGQDYNYARNVLSPTQINILEFGSDQSFNLLSNNGLPELAADFAGLIKYVELLVSGTSDAATTGKPLGNRFFLQTAAKCKDSSNNDQDRYLYVNNIPSGTLPIISNISGKNFTEFRGLVPGILSQLEVLNPISLFGGMFVSSDSSCTTVELSVVDTSNNRTFESNYVLNSDIVNIDPCVFKDQINTLTQQTCANSEAFTNINSNINLDINSNKGINYSKFINFENEFNKLNDNLNNLKNNSNFFNDDNLRKIYFAILTILYFYIFLRLMLKH